MKSDFYIDRVSKEEVKDLLYTHHYLKDESKDFKSGYNYGLFKHTEWECPLRIGGGLAVWIFSGGRGGEKGGRGGGGGRGGKEGLKEGEWGG